MSKKKRTRAASETLAIENEAAKERVLKMIEAGKSEGEACRLAGVPKATHYSWKRSDPLFEYEVKQASLVKAKKIEDAMIAAALGEEDYIRLPNGMPKQFWNPDTLEFEFRKQRTYCYKSAAFMLMAADPERYCPHVRTVKHKAMLEKVYPWIKEGGDAGSFDESEIDELVGSLASLEAKKRDA